MLVQNRDLARLVNAEQCEVPIPYTGSNAQIRVHSRLFNSNLSFLQQRSQWQLAVKGSFHYRILLLHGSSNACFESTSSRIQWTAAIQYISVSCNDMIIPLRGIVSNRQRRRVFRTCCIETPAFCTIRTCRTSEIIIALHSIVSPAVCRDVDTAM